MATIWERVDDALTTLGIPMAASSYSVDSGEVLPDTYIVYFVFSFDPELHADNEEVLRSEAVQVSIYRRAGMIGLPDVIGAMITAGFTFIGGREMDKTEDGHFAISFDFEYLEEV
jgi:hypothetical protein